MGYSLEAAREGASSNHFVVGPMPTQWSEARGFRRGSNAVVQCDLVSATSGRRSAL